MGRLLRVVLVVVVLGAAVFVAEIGRRPTPRPAACTYDRSSYAFVCREPSALD